MEQTIAVRRVFEGRLLKVDVIDVSLSGGRQSVREVVRHPGAVAVLAELPDGRFVLVRQFRKAVEQALTEVVAGGMEPGEDPADCAVRELREETGYEAERLTLLGVIAAAPGYAEERLHIFHAKLKPCAHAPTPEADEDLEVLHLSPAELGALLDGAGLLDGKTLAAWALYKRRMGGGR